MPPLSSWYAKSTAALTLKVPKAGASLTNAFKWGADRKGTKDMVGKRFAYRKQVRAFGKPVQPVEVVREGPPRSARVRIRYLDGEYEGLEEWVPKARLLVPWDEAKEFCEDERRLLAAQGASGEVHGTLFYKAVETVFYAIARVFDEELILFGWRAYERDLLIIREFHTTVQKLRLNREELLLEPHSFVNRHGHYVAPFQTAERLGKLFCQRFPREILQYMRAKEEDLRQKIITADNPSTRSFHEEWQGKSKAAFMVVREWCGQKAVAEFDEVAALQKEVRRLRDVIQSTARWLRDNGHSVKASLLLKEINDLGHSESQNLKGR